MSTTKIKIKHKNRSRWGGKLIIPIDGIVSVGKAGTTEVSEEAAKLLLTKSTDWEQIAGQKDILAKPVTKGAKTSKSAKKAVKEEELEEEEEEELDEEVDVEEEEAATEEADADVVEDTDPNGLDSMDLENLINIAETSEITGWEKFRHSEKGLRTYLKNRMNS